MKTEELKMSLDITEFEIETRIMFTVNFPLMCSSLSHVAFQVVCYSLLIHA